MAKRLVVLIGILAVVLVAAIPALAQEEKGSSKVEEPTKEGQAEKEPVEKEETRVEPAQVEPEEKPPEEANREANTREEAAGERYARAVKATGVLRAGLPADVAANGSHSINDEDSSTTYALRSESVDLDEYVGEQVIVYGVTVPGSGSPAGGGFGSGSLPLLEVYQVEPVDGPDGPPVYCAAIGCKPGDPITATFRLTIEGEVPDGQLLALDYDPVGRAVGEAVIFCTTSVFYPELPTCESGETYSGTVEVPAEYPFSFEYTVLDDYSDFGEAFFSDTKAFSLGDDTVSATYRAGEGPGGPRQCDRGHPFECRPGDELTATFELAVEGKPPAGTTFFATGVADPRIADLTPVQQLEDPDGDGIYSAEEVTIPGDYRLKIVQGTGTRSCGEFGGTCPGEPSSTIKDFGTVTLEDDETFSASVSFKDNKGGTTKPDPGNGGSNNGGSGGGGSGGGGSGSGSNNGGFGGPFLGSAGGIRGFLPNTGGGMALTTLGVGAMLIGGGLLVRRLTR